jgi:hypothetical protein
VVREGERESNLAAGCARARLVALSSDENVANRNASVVTLAPGFGRGRQKRVLERWTNHKLPRRACSPRYGLQSSPGVECRPRAPEMLVTTIRNFSGTVRAFDLRWGFKRQFPSQVLGQWCDLLSPSQSPGPAPPTAAPTTPGARRLRRVGRRRTRQTSIASPTTARNASPSTLSRSAVRSATNERAPAAASTPCAPPPSTHDFSSLQQKNRGKPRRLWR